jgi:hydroxymethylpyrimidine pyrophosphatase-like HAD family hydrolase
MTDASVPPNRTIAAVLADVDGILVTRDKVLTPRAIEAIERLHELGTLFAIISGRPPRGMRMVVRPWKCAGPWPHSTAASSSSRT